MDAAEYQRQTARTWNNHTGDHNAQLCNAALGLVGELAEFECSPSADELGDVWYYLVTLERLLGFNWLGYGTGVEDARWGYRFACRVAELVKKKVFHDKDGDEIERQLKHSLYMVQGYLIHKGSELGLRKEEVWQQNIDKLRERYPEGFESERAPG